MPEHDQIERALDAGLKLARHVHYWQGIVSGAGGALTILVLTGEISWWAALMLVGVGLIVGEIAERRERARQREKGIDT